MLATNDTRCTTDDDQRTLDNATGTAQASHRLAEDETWSDFKAKSSKSTKSVKNPIARWTFQRNRNNSTCTAKSPFALNHKFNCGSNRLQECILESNINYVQS